MTKIVFSDIDGTFLNDEHEVGAEHAAAVRGLLARGIPFVLVSARMPEAIYPITDGLGLERLPIISYSGALALAADGTELASVTMERRVTARLLAIITARYPEVAVNYYAGHSWYVEDASNERVQFEVSITGVQPEVESFATLIAEEILPHKLLIMADPAVCEQAESELGAEFPELNVVRSAPFLLEIMMASVSKASGIAAMLAHFGLTRDDALSFGDNYNDLAMLEYTGTSVAMANAPARVQAAATEVTASNNDAGIYQYLKKYAIID